MAELEWGKEGFEQQVAALAQIPVDWVLAADCLYIDNVSGIQLPARMAHATLLAHLP